MNRYFLTALLCCSLVGTAAYADELKPSGEGMVVRFDAGGGVGEAYATTVVKGAQQAARDLGCKLEVVYSDWQPEKMLENFKNGLASHPTGFVVMGHPGDDAFRPFVQQAFNEGSIVTSVDTRLPELQKEFGSKGFGFIGTDNADQGTALGEKVIAEAKLTSGDRVFVWGLKSLEGRGRRARALIKVFEDAGLTVDYLEISPEINKDVSLGAPVLTGYLSSHPDCKAIVVDHGALTGQLGNFLKAAGYKAGQVYASGFSLTPATVAALQDGYVSLVSEAQPYLMGYLSVTSIVNTAKYGFTGLTVDTGGGFVSSENIEKIAPLANQGIR